MAGFSRAVSIKVWEDANGRCIRCGAYVPYGSKPHHIRPRGMGGTSNPDINKASNGELLCYQCHQLKEWGVK